MVVSAFNITKIHSTEKNRHTYTLIEPVIDVLLLEIFDKLGNIAFAYEGVAVDKQCNLEDGAICVSCSQGPNPWVQCAFELFFKQLKPPRMVDWAVIDTTVATMSAVKSDVGAVFVKLMAPYQT